MEILRDCQNEAIDKFNKYFYIDDDGENDRGIISMCCGSGKTRTMYEIIKTCQIKYNKKFFIIATSRIKLIYQLYKDFNNWKLIENKNFNIKIIGGSGEEFSNDTLSNSIDDVIENNINNNNPLIIITTYQSSNKIVEAIKGKSKLLPDLIILDESHNTTGENEKQNRTLIKKSDDDPENIFTSDKYLFMTATPVQLLLKNKEASYNNDETVYTMNNEAIYGKMIYEYSFFQGMNSIPPILVPFETIYYNAKDEIPDDIKQTIVDMNKKQKQTLYFETISGFLIENITKYNLKYILVYLQNKEKLDLMKNNLEDIIINLKLKYNVYTILSDQKKSDRNKNLQNFKTLTQFANILLSVGIFDEGVDEPCIDSVMFAEERNTESRIVQNIGRCLRLSPKTGKKKSYVIIPNVVYEFNTGNSNLSITNTYSSCYKKIRELITILNKPCKNKFYKKYVKGTDPNYSDDEDNDKINIADNYVIENNITAINDDIKSSNINLSIYYDQLCTNDSIGNELLENIKSLITERNIKSVYEYGIHFKDTPYHILHNEYKSEWISWSHILYDTVYSYADAKQFIQSLNIKFNECTEWIKYYNDLLHDELNDNRSTNYELFNDIIKIPNRPKEYYKGEWIDWNDFLNLNTDNLNILLINQNGHSETKADKNIRIFLNTDSEKVMKFNNGEYNNITFKTDISPIKKYVDNVLGINCYLVPRILIKNNGNFDKLCINCYIIGKQTNKPLLILWPDDRKYSYDSINLHNNNINFTTDIHRNKEDYIQNKDIIRLFEELIIECKGTVNKLKNNT